MALEPTSQDAAPIRRPLARIAAHAEGGVFALGLVLRLLLAVTLPPMPGGSYEITAHLGYAHYIDEFGTLPPTDFNRETYHPPLHYLVVVGLHKLGFGMQALRGLSILEGIARLALIWWGLRRLFRADRITRLVGLALAAVLPCTVHLDGMSNNENELALFSTLALALIPGLFAAQGRRRWVRAAALGLVLALALWTKMSALMIVAAVIGGIGLEAFRLSGKERRAAVSAALLAPILGLALGLPIYFIRDPRRPFAPSFERLPYLMARSAALADTPYWRRRPPSYFFRLDPEIVAVPFYPMAAHSFFPVLVASTFGDYYNASYVGTAPRDERSVIANGAPMPRATLPWLRLSVAAGGLISLMTFAALLGCLGPCVRRRDATSAVLLAAPLLALVGQVHFAIQFPFDDMGVVKGHHIQFAAAPLFGLFGLAVSFLWRRARTRPLAIFGLAALVCVVLYSVDARTGLLRG